LVVTNGGHPTRKGVGGVGCKSSCLPTMSEIGGGWKKKKEISCPKKFKWCGGLGWCSHSKNSVGHHLGWGEGKRQPSTEHKTLGNKTPKTGGGGGGNTFLNKKTGKGKNVGNNPKKTKGNGRRKTPGKKVDTKKRLCTTEGGGKKAQPETPGGGGGSKKNATPKMEGWGVSTTVPSINKALGKEGSLGGATN